MNSSGVASSSHGPARATSPGQRRLPNSAAMVRHWLREMAAVLRSQPMGATIPLLLEEAMQEVGLSQREPTTCDSGPLSGAPIKKRKVINYLSVARMRLQDLTEEDDMDGLNQHQIREDLNQALHDLQVGEIVMQRATGGQWGHQVEQGHLGVQQAQQAVQAAIAATVNGDLDWHVPGWGRAVTVLLEDAENVLEEGQLDFVLPSDVAALDEGAEEAPPIRQGEPMEQIDRILRDIVGAMAFVERGHQQVRQLVAAVTVWRDAAQGVPIEVDTQSTNAGDNAGDPPQPTQPARWIPPLDAEQWSGTIPSSTVEEDTQTSEAGHPTDADLLQALEEYKRSEQQQAADEAQAQVSPPGTEPDRLSEGSHRRRRFSAAVADP